MPSSRLRSSTILRWVFPGLFVAFAIWMAIASTGFLEADELTHFLLGRQMAGNWKELLTIWGRPACTGLYGLAAMIGGLVGARLLAVLITTLTAIGTVKLWEVIRGENPADEKQSIFKNGHVFWVWALFFAQPMVLLNSFTIMTEMLLACAWVWAMVCLGKNRSAWASLLIGLGVLARPEGIIAVLLWGGVLLLWKLKIFTHQSPPSATARANVLAIREELLATDLKIQKGKGIRPVILGMAIAILPLVIWCAAGAFAYQDISWMIQKFPWHMVSQYGKTGLLFLESSLVALAIWMWLPVALGSWILRRNHKAMLLAVLPILGFFLLHGILGTFGLMGSLSLPRYFVCVAPFVAVVALIGLETMEYRIRWPRLLRRAAMMLALLPAILLLVMGQLPETKSMDLEKLDFAVSGFERRCLALNIPPAQRDQWLIAGHPYIFYRMHLSLDSPAHLKMFSRDAIRNAPPGTVLISDAILWGWEGQPNPQELVSWGYAADPLVAAQVSSVTPRFDLSAIGTKQTTEVEMWVKQQ